MLKNNKQHFKKYAFYLALFPIFQHKNMISGKLDC